MCFLATIASGDATSDASVAGKELDGKVVQYMRVYLEKHIHVCRRNLWEMAKMDKTFHHITGAEATK